MFLTKSCGCSVSRALFRSSDWASNLVKKNKYFNIISKGVKRDGWKFVLLARFSPVPSYVINYGLAATDIDFFIDYLLPTIAGGLPMIIQNTSIGSLTSAATQGGGAESSSDKSGILPYLLPAIGICSSMMITWRIKKYASAQEFNPSDMPPINGIDKDGRKD
jgi:uncharacterized membrane protein YdjX (TVP38/TMEM64 family)